MRYAVILAGGSGTRLWPASRRARPKQLLPLGPNGDSLLEAAIRRGRSVAGARILVVTGADQAAATRAIVGDVEVLEEPVGRNTAAAIGLAAAVLARRDPDAVIAVLPADQHVADEPALAAILGRAFEVAVRDDVIGTVGITPTRPETGFGYLELAATTDPDAVVPVVRFVEKPELATAEAYVRSGRYLWNAGIFVVTARRLLAELDARLAATAQAVRAIAAGTAEAGDVYPALASISIDHAVMEHAERVVTIAASVGWDDVGSWAAIPALLATDAAGNTVRGRVVSLDGTGNVVMSDDDTLIATLGVSDLVVVKSGDAILIIRRDQAQDVRKVVEALSAQGFARYL